ncbi:MAG: hypothetical protein Roseis2KO_59490 [Roseivirga sp.]
MFEGLIDTLESFVADLSATESALIDEQKQKVIAHSKIELEGDQLAIIDQAQDENLIRLHNSMTRHALDGKGALLKMAGIVLDELNPT